MDFLQTVRGMRDLLPDEARVLRFIEKKARHIAELYGYEEVITPVIEHYELLAAKIGEENRKRMYVFEDLGGRKVALRPEFTASIARLVATKMASSPKPIRLFSIGSLYRYDEPQLGRYREFWQANYELIGSNKPEADAEVISLTVDFLNCVGVRNHTLKINHIGILRGILEREGVSEDGQNALMQRLDKKDLSGAMIIAEEHGVSKGGLETLKDLFSIRGNDREEVTRRIGETLKDYPEAKEALRNLDEIIDLVRDGGVDAKFYFEASFARGLEYYTGIIFEVYVPELDIAVGGGGRYDNLIGIFGGGDVPAVGVALGVDRLMLAMKRQGVDAPKEQRIKALIIPVNEENISNAFKISVMLRRYNIPAEVEVMRRGLSRALSDASRRNITHVIIVGSKEISEGKVVLKNMERGIQEAIKIEDLPNKIGS
ncbi:histidine--tRNA ligase [Candidatus Bathyarchaeota archaeon]|nr:histidine--tRNA ligase [Candidatus Bathyarchaeota archaeon]